MQPSFGWDKFPNNSAKLVAHFTCLLNSGSSTVFKVIFRATYARHRDATPLSYDLTEPPSLLQIDSKNPLGVQRMGLPRCSKALSEPFVLDRCRTSLLFDATSKSHANRFQRSVGYSNSASSMLFKRIFRTACARFIDATPLSCDLAEPPSLLQTAIAYLNRASSMSFIFFLSNPFPSIFRQIPRIYLRNRLPSLLFQVDAAILMLKHVSHFLFEHVFRASGEDAVIFWTLVARIHLMKLIDCPLCRFDAAILFSLKQVPKPILWDKSSTCLLSSGSSINLLAVTLVSNRRHFCVIWRSPQILSGSREETGWQTHSQVLCRQNAKIHSCGQLVTRYIFWLSVTDAFLFDPPVESHFEKVTLWSRLATLRLSLMPPSFCWDRFPNPRSRWP